VHGAVAVAAFREEARAWLASVASLRDTAEWGTGDDSVAVFESWTAEEENEHTERIRAWERLRYDSGWGALSWPASFGGRGLPAHYEHAYRTEEAAFDVPRRTEIFPVTQNLVAPAIRIWGTAEQQERWIRPMLRTDVLACQLFSETEAGSDLAAVRTRAVRDGDSWVLNGHKVWTSGARVSSWGVAVCRTDPAASKHAGITVFLVPMDAPGVTVRPIRFMNGEHHFNEVFLDNVFVPDDRVVGEIGQGWKQVTSELALERSGPERYMTTFPLFTELMRRLGGTPDTRAAEAAGKLAARMWSLRRMSLAIAITLDPGPDSEQGTPKATVDLATEAALVKDMGTFFEREIIDAARLLATVEPAPDAADLFERYLADTIVCAPVSTIRGGTTQVLRNLIARKLLGPLK